MELIKWQNGRTPAFRSLFDEFFNDETLTQLGGRTMACAAPAVNVKEGDKEFTIEVAAPGFKKEAFKIELNPENLLTLSAEVKTESEDKQQGRYTRREFSFSNFSRSFTLPKNVDAGKIEASYSDGILVITLPKKEAELQKSTRMIDIK